MITVASVERGILSAYGRVGGWMAAVGMDLAASGSNPDLAGPIARAARRCGIPPADPSLVADPDLAGVPDARYEELVDRAILATLESIQGSISRVSTTSLDLSVQWNDLAARVARELARKEGEILGRYGPGVADRGASFASGSIALPRTCERPFDNRYPPRAGYLGGY